MPREATITRLTRGDRLLLHFRRHSECKCINLHAPSNVTIRFPRLRFKGSYHHANDLRTTARSFPILRRDAHFREITSLCVSEANGGQQPIPTILCQVPIPTLTSDYRSLTSCPRDLWGADALPASAYRLRGPSPCDRVYAWEGSGPSEEGIWGTYRPSDRSSIFRQCANVVNASSRANRNCRSLNVTLSFLQDRCPLYQFLLHEEQLQTLHKASTPGNREEVFRHRFPQEGACLQQASRTFPWEDFLSIKGATAKCCSNRPLQRLRSRDRNATIRYARERRTSESSATCPDRQYCMQGRLSKACRGRLHTSRGEVYPCLSKAGRGKRSHLLQGSNARLCLWEANEKVMRARRNRGKEWLRIVRPANSYREASCECQLQVQATLLCTFPAFQKAKSCES